jgi:hypothetical protein
MCVGVCDNFQPYPCLCVCVSVCVCVFISSYMHVVSVLSAVSLSRNIYVCVRSFSAVHVSLGVYVCVGVRDCLRSYACYLVCLFCFSPLCVPVCVCVCVCVCDCVCSCYTYLRIVACDYVLAFVLICI